MENPFNRQAFRLAVIGMVLAGVSALDYITGNELNFFVFYFIPAALTAWYGYFVSAVAVAFLSALVWIGFDVIQGSVYSNPLIPVWNTIIRLIAFLIIAWMVSRIRQLLDGERKNTEELRRALAAITVLEGILPVCASCKRIRTKENEWQQMEVYISGHSNAEFSHGLCPDCARKFMEEAGLIRSGRTGGGSDGPSGAGPE